MRKVLSETGHSGMKNCDVSANIQALLQQFGSSRVVTLVLIPLTVCWASWGGVPTSHCPSVRFALQGGGKLQVRETAGWVVASEIRSHRVCGVPARGQLHPPVQL